MCWVPRVPYRGAVADSRADWSQLTAWLRSRSVDLVVVSWAQLDRIVGGMPASSIRHYPQWWHGDRPNTRAWRAAGFEPKQIRPGEVVTFQRTGAPTAASGIASAKTAAPTGRPIAHLAGPAAAREQPGWLVRTDPERALIVIACSASKAIGGDARPRPARWSPDLVAARAVLATTTAIDDRLLMPAWQRYTGFFYTSAADALTDATARRANIVIISGGYGVLSADEPIGTYNRVFRHADWPPGLLEDLLCEHARRTGARSMVAFLAASTEYARLVRRTPWRSAGITEAALVSVASAGGGAMVTVPRALGSAFRAFWYRSPDLLPDGISVESL
ncbi:hypothetical protein Are01nite_63610 [Actinoplanes regularis]|nr:hypothetical protein Are01nite_63610 [Actinoplanes regularis]